MSLVNLYQPFVFWSTEPDEFLSRLLRFLSTNFVINLG